MRKHLGWVLSLAMLSATTLLAGWDEGVAAFKSGDYQLAVSHFQQYIDEAEALGTSLDTPEYAPVFMMLGQSYDKLGKSNDAIDAYKKALELKSGDPNTQLLLGRAYYQGKDYKSAAGVLGQIQLAALPDKHKAMIAKMLATSYQKSGDSGRALATWEKAAALSPSDAAVQFNYGTQALAAGYTDDAVGALGKAVSLDSKDASKVRAYVNALVRKGRETPDANGKAATYGKAVSAAQTLTQLDGSYDNILLLAETQLGAKKYGDAIATLGKATAKNSSDWLSYYYLGQAHTANRTYNDAVDPLKAALSKPKADQAKVWSQLGFVYEKLKQYDEAESAYRKAGNSNAADRVAQNREIQAENKDIEEHNKRIEELEQQKKELEKQMQALPGSTSSP